VFAFVIVSSPGLVIDRAQLTILFVFHSDARARVARTRHYVRRSAHGWNGVFFYLLRKGNTEKRSDCLPYLSRKTKQTNMTPIAFFFEKREGTFSIDELSNPFSVAITSESLGRKNDPLDYPTDTERVTVHSRGGACASWQSLSVQPHSTIFLFYFLLHSFKTLALNNL